MCFVQFEQCKTQSWRMIFLTDSNNFSHVLCPWKMGKGLNIKHDTKIISGNIFKNACMNRFISSTKTNLHYMYSSRIRSTYYPISNGHELYDLLIKFARLLSPISSSSHRQLCINTTHI